MIKCSKNEHEDKQAVVYCPECKLYLCNKCLNYHSELFKGHIKYNLNKNLNEFFTGMCPEGNHKNNLDFFCKNHNKLVCVSCISKIKCQGYGQHTDCNVCLIKEIKNEKKNKLKEIIRHLENISINIEESINKLKVIIQKLNKNKEDAKMNIQKIFTDIRNVLNKREDELLLDIDKRYSYLNEEFDNKNETTKENIKIYLNKSKKIIDEWNKEDKLKTLINDCINIENDIKIIDDINNNLEKNKNINPNIKFHITNKDMEVFLNKIKNFGDIILDNKFNLEEYRNTSNYVSIFTRTIIDIKDLEKELKKNTNHGLCGNKNLGNTSFINSSIVCFSNCIELTTYFLTKKFKLDIDRNNKEGYDGKFANAWYDLVEHYWNSNLKFVDPYPLKLIVENKDKKFQDSKEFMELFLSILNEELNKKSKKIYKELKEKEENESELECAKRFWDLHSENNNSIITDLFSGLLKSEVRCLNPDCKYKNITFEHFNILTLPIPNHKEIYINGITLKNFTLLMHFTCISHAFHKYFT